MLAGALAMDGNGVASASGRRPHQTGWPRPASGTGGRGPRHRPSHGSGFMSEPTVQPVEPCVVGYVIKMFPRLSETFILNEVLELERQGLRLHIFSLKRPTAGRLEACPTTVVQAPVTYLPERVYREPGRILRAQFGIFRRYGRAYFRALWHVLRGRELRSMARGLRRFCQTCCLVHEMDGVKHLHAHFATDPTRL